MKQYNSWHSYKRLLRFIVPYKKKLSIAVVCMAFSGLSNVVVPWVSRMLSIKFWRKRMCIR